MLPVVVLNHAWKEALGWSDSDVASVLFDLDQVSAVAVPAGQGDVCPRCRRHPVDSVGWLFTPEPETSRAEEVKGRQLVICLCKTVYSFAAVHAVDAGEPIGRAVVRAASGPQHAELPPGTNNTLDEANRMASRPVPFVTNQHFPFIHAATRLYYSSEFPGVPPEDKK